MQKELMSTDKMAMLDNACDELLSYGIWDAKTTFKNLIKKVLLRQITAPEDTIFWPNGLLASALWHNRNSASVTLQNKIDIVLAEYFNRWEKRKTPIFYLDDLLSGETFLAIYEQYINDKQSKSKANDQGNIINDRNELKYKNALDKFAEYALNYPTDETGSFPYRAAQGTGHIYVDSIGLACPFLYEYGNYNKKNEYMELALKQIANFLAYGIDTATGLPYHGYDVTTGIRYGIIGWGRAVGWLLRGMTGCMTTDYGKERLSEAYISLTDSVIAWQRKDGSFSWQLQAVEGPADTSAAGMICVALNKGLQMNILRGESYENALELGTRAIQKSIKNGRVYNCSGECEGFAQYPQRYGAYPWSLAPALMLPSI
ncbi:MAG: glycoside hydrolase family 88 protein [Lachnospiraceae bacterium]|nr:glycoside hydrolase family 88 protein [Lachnospiraceae bacterium]